MRHRSRDCRAADEVVDPAVAVDTESLVKAGWGRLDGWDVVDGSGVHDGWEGMSWKVQPESAVVGNEGGRHEGTARTPSYVCRFCERVLTGPRLGRCNFETPASGRDSGRKMVTAYQRRGDEKFVMPVLIG